MKLKLILFFCLITSMAFVYSQTKKPAPKPHAAGRIKVGAERTDQYLELLQDKRVALVVNQASMIGNTHLVDSLKKLKVNVVKIFAPEHGFRGTADAGEVVASSVDKKTGIPIVSLYGAHKQPTAADLANVDVIVFDIQDVGVRFYTFIGTLHYVMLAAALNNKSVIVFDRPNPNGMYVDGPILDMKYSSFVGMHPVPVVHGNTMGEMAQMINGEHWLIENNPALNKNVGDDLYCNLSVIPCYNYNHLMRYHLPVPPSPNLPDIKSVYLYASLCWFEGTPISVGRGTDKPFQQYGSPDLKSFTYSFTPKSTSGAKEPPCKNQVCYGEDLSGLTIQDLEKNRQLHLSYLIAAYKAYPQKDKFFTSFFTSLAGGKTLQGQIEKGMSEDEIRKTWQVDLAKYKLMRQKYLLYKEG